MSALQQLQACHIDGYWRVFDLDYRDQVFQSILTLLEEEDWSWSEVPLRECCDKLSQLEPTFAIEHCLNCYGIRHSKEGKDDWFELIEDKVCQFFAELFLRPAGKVSRCREKFQEIEHNL
jgi:sister chromatid cohesion protein DCC1